MRAYIGITGLVFGAIALAHVARLILGWPAQVGGWDIPMWLSWIAILIPGALCIWAIRLLTAAR